jgi:hypothetical protein
VVGALAEFPQDSPAIRQPTHCCYRTLRFTIIIMKSYPHRKHLHNHFHLINSLSVCPTQSVIRYSIPQIFSYKILCAFLASPLVVHIMAIYTYYVKLIIFLLSTLIKSSVMHHRNVAASSDLKSKLSKQAAGSSAELCLLHARFTYKL